MTIEARQIREGMTVRNSNGERIGKIAAVEGGDTFRVRRGHLVHDEYLISARDVVELRDGELVVEMLGTIPGEMNEGRNAGSRGLDVAERTDDRLA